MVWPYFIKTYVNIIMYVKLIQINSSEFLSMYTLIEKNIIFWYFYSSGSFSQIGFWVNVVLNFNISVVSKFSFIVIWPFYNYKIVLLMVYQIKWSLSKCRDHILVDPSSVKLVFGFPLSDRYLQWDPKVKIILSLNQKKCCKISECRKAWETNHQPAYFSDEDPEARCFV